MPADAYPRCLMCGHTVEWDTRAGDWRHPTAAIAVDRGCPRNQPVTALLWPGAPQQGGLMTERPLRVPLRIS